MLLSITVFEVELWRNFNLFEQEAWYCVGAKGRPATGYLEEHLRYVRKKEKSLRVPVAEDEAESQKQGILATFSYS